MIDSLFSAALAFAVLIGGTLAVGSAVVDAAQPRVAVKQTQQVQKMVTSSQACAVAAGAQAACL